VFSVTKRKHVERRVAWRMRMTTRCLLILPKQ
jgi:hypothetical protein